MRGSGGHIPRAALYLAGVVGAVAFALNAVAVGVPLPWRDEAATHLANQRSIGQLWSMLGHVDAVHGAYYVLVRVWQHLFGGSPVSLRLLSVLAIAVGAALMSLLAAELFGKRAAWWAGMTYAVLPPLTWAATEARSYALSAALVTATMLFFWLSVRKGGWWWVGYAVLAAASVAVFVYSALALVGLAVVGIWLPSRTRIAAALASAAAALAVLPLLIVVPTQTGQVSWLADQTLGVTDIVGRAFWGPVDPATWIGVGLSLAGIGYACWSLRDRALRAPLVGVLAWLVVPSLVLVLLNTQTPAYHPRYVTFSVPALALLGSLPLSRLRSWRAVLAGVVLVAVCAPAFVESRGPDAKQTARPAAAILADLSRPGDGLYIVRYDRHALAWSFPESVAGLRNVGADTRNAWRSVSLKQPSRKVPGIAGRLGSVDRIWVWADGGLRLAQTEEAFARLGYRTTRTVQVSQGYPVTLALLERG